MHAPHRPPTSGFSSSIRSTPGEGGIPTAHLDRDRAGRWARAALSNASRTYPNAPQLLLAGADDLAPPDELHPAFHGAFDWHSAVHTHWALVRLLRLFPGLDTADEIRRLLADHLTGDALRSETEHLRNHPVFERPYGWAWGLALASEIDRWDDSGSVVDAEGVRSFADGIRELLMGFLPRLTYPIREGTHSNTAFALLLALDHARQAEDDELAERVVTTARRWYLQDRDAPVMYEPSGEDFLSPILMEAHLMGQILGAGVGAGDFDEWFERFLPGIGEVIAPPLREPPTVIDDDDDRLVHLRGLTLSRSWSWRAIGRALPARDERRVAALDAADHHLADGLEHVLTGSYEGDHWLVTFALLATTGL